MVEPLRELNGRDGDRDPPERGFLKDNKGRPLAEGHHQLPIHEVIVLLYHHRLSRTAVVGSCRSPLLPGVFQHVEREKSLSIACLP